MMLTQDRLDLGYKCVHSKDDHKFFITQIYEQRNTKLIRVQFLDLILFTAFHFWKEFSMEKKRGKVAKV